MCEILIYPCTHAKKKTTSMKLFCITLVELQRWLYIVDRNNLTERCEPTAVDEPATEHQQYIRLEVKQVCSMQLLL